MNIYPLPNQRTSYAWPCVLACKFHNIFLAFPEVIFYIISFGSTSIEINHVILPISLCQNECDNTE